MEARTSKTPFEWNRVECSNALPFQKRSQHCHPDQHHPSDGSPARRDDLSRNNAKLERLAPAWPAEDALFLLLFTLISSSFLLICDATAGFRCCLTVFITTNINLYSRSFSHIACSCLFGYLRRICRNFTIVCREHF